MNASRKWKGFLSYIDLKEYTRVPEEMGTNVPTNSIVRKEYLDMKKIKENEEMKRGIENVLGGSPQKPKPLNFVYEFLLKKKGFSSRLDLEEAFASKNLLAEYNRLNEAYGADLANQLKAKVDLKNWAGIPGDDFVPEEEESTADAQETPAGEAAPSDAE